ncbi:MAG: hypothetical protein ACXW2P_04605 [Thermoanaerobaculia bacterium]
MPQEQPDKVVSITMRNGLPVPDQDPVVVKKDTQKVRWNAAFPFEIDIEGYKDVKYGSNGNSDYRCTTGTFAEIRKYKYSITANGVTNDPDIDIKP